MMTPWCFGAGIWKDALARALFNHRPSRLFGAKSLGTDITYQRNSLTSSLPTPSNLRCELAVFDIMTAQESIETAKTAIYALPIPQVR
jgi:hypothetical protein